MENKLVSVRNLSHRYSSQWAVRNVSFDIDESGVTGLLGSNGAGKSTTMNIICGVLRQTEGDVFIDGIDLKKDPVRAKQNIGFLPQTPPLYKDYTVQEYLTHCAHLHLMPRKEISAAVERAMEKCKITHFRNRVIKYLSGGYQQRVGIAQAIIHNPRFVILDEPTNGLDPNQIVEIRNLIRDIAKHHAVLLSTHILSEVQAICSSIRMIENGEIVFNGTMDEFDNYVKPESFIVEYANAVPTEELAKVCGEECKAEALSPNRYRIRFGSNNELSEKLIRYGYEKNWDLIELTVERLTLDEIFAHLSKCK
ncbi:MAG: ABC transporter ATP-binding protein [Rikenellaceae bacterium]